MPIIFDNINSFDNRLGVSIELNFHKFNALKIITGCVTDIGSGIKIIASPELDIVEEYEKFGILKENEWLNFHEKYNQVDRISEYSYFNPVMSVFLQITDMAVNASLSVLRVGFKLCRVNEKITWQGKGPIMTEMLVKRCELNKFIEDLNIQYCME